MPKMKTNSSVKKRFRATASGKIKMSQAGKQHNMIKRTNKQLRQQRGTTVMNPTEATKIRKMAPYGL